MPSKRLTEAAVAKLKPPPHGTQIDYFDAVMPGLVLRLNYGGRKTWRALYYVKRDKRGKHVTEPRTHPIGLYPILNLKQAREKARAFLEDPQKALQQRDVGSFGQVAANYIKRHVDENKLRTKKEIERILNKYLLPRWGDRPFTELKRNDVAILLDQIVDEHGPVQADQALALISSICTWYQSRDDNYVSPVVRRMRRTNPAERRRTRVIGNDNDDELRAFWQAASECGTFGAMAKMLLLTGQRLRKVTHMRHDDISSDGVWTIKTEHREKGNPGSLRLPQLALDIIAGQYRILNNPYVFVGKRGPINSFSDSKDELDDRMKRKFPALKQWQLHDLRRTARSLLARADVRPDIAERVLGHKIAGVEGIYDRHRYDDEKADALQRLAALIETILNPPKGNVVTLRKRKR
jgi:hypothetical protein